MRRGMVLGGLGLCTVLGVAATATSADAGALIFAAGQGAYLLAATVVMVTAGERLLVLALAPAVLWSAGFLLAGRPDWLQVGMLAAQAGSVLATVALAWTRRMAGVPSVTRAGVFLDLRGALPHACFGLAVAGLVTLPILVGAADDPGNATVAVWATIALSTSMGPAEWLLHGYRARTSRLLRTTYSTDEFARATRRALLDATLRHVAVNAILIGSISAVAVASRAAPHVPGFGWVTYLILGAALFVALLLQAVAASGVTVMACALAVAAEVVLVYTHRLDVLTAQAVIGAGLTVSLLAQATVVLGRCTVHF